MRAAVCRDYGAPGVVRVEDLAAAGARRRAGAGAGPGGRGQLPRRADRRERVPDQGADAVRARQRVRRRGHRGRRRRRRAAGGRPRVRNGDLRRVRGGGGRRRRDGPAPSRTASTIGTPPPSASRTAPPTTCSGRSRASRPGDELIVLGAGGGVGLAAVQLGAVLGATVTAVASSPEKLEVAVGVRRPPPRRLSVARVCGRRSARSSPTAATSVVDPVGGDLAEPALRALRYGGRFVTVGYASGVIPKIPLNLVLLKGVHVLGFQLLTLPRQRARTSSSATSASCSRCSPRTASCPTSARRSPSTTPRPRCSTSPTARPSARSSSTSPERGPVAGQRPSRPCSMMCAAESISGAARRRAPNAPSIVTMTNASMSTSPNFRGCEKPHHAAAPPVEGGGRVGSERLVVECRVERDPEHRRLVRHASRCNGEATGAASLGLPGPRARRRPECLRTRSATLRIACRMSDARELVLVLEVAVERAVRHAGRGDEVVDACAVVSVIEEHPPAGPHEGVERRAAWPRSTRARRRGAGAAPRWPRRSRCLGGRGPRVECTFTLGCRPKNDRCITSVIASSTRSCGYVCGTTVRRMLATSSVRCWLSISNAISGSSRRGGNVVAAMPERNRATWRSPHRAEPSATTSSVSDAASNVAEDRFVTFVDLGVTGRPSRGARGRPAASGVSGPSASIAACIWRATCPVSVAEHVLLAREVLVEGDTRAAGALRDPVDAALVVSLLPEHAQGGVEDPLLRPLPARADARVVGERRSARPGRARAARHAGGSPWELVARGAIDQTDTTVRTMSPAIEPFRIAVDDAVARRSAPPSRGRASSRIRSRAPAGSTGSRPTTCASWWSTGATSTTGGRRRRGSTSSTHFRTRIDGQSIHFIHARSPHADAFPLLLMHGWPGSIVEFLEVIPRLTDPEAYGGHAATPSTSSCPRSRATASRSRRAPVAGT